MSDITLNNSSYNSENEPSGNKSPEYNVPPLLKLLHYIFTFVPIEQGFFFERPIKSKLKKIHTQFTIEKEFTSNDGRITKHDNYNNILNLCVFIFATLFFWLIYQWQKDYLNPYTISFKWYNFVSMLCILGALYVWIYAYLKNLQNYEEMKSIFVESDTYQKNILLTLKKLILPFPFIAHCNIVDILIKTVIEVIWIIIARSLFIACTSIHIFTNGIGPRNTLENKIHIFGCVLIVAGMTLNFFSYYASLVYCYIIRLISTSNIKCEDKYVNPANSRYLRTLIRITTRISVSFLIVSTLYLLAFSFSLVPLLMRKCHTYTKYLQLHNYGILIIGITLLLCLISYLIVAFLPKIFIYRLFNKWKDYRIKDLESNLDDADFRNTFYRNAINKDISDLISLKLPIEKKELVIGIITILINVAALIINFGTLIVSLT